MSERNNKPDIVDVWAMRLFVLGYILVGLNLFLRLPNG